MANNDTRIRDIRTGATLKVNQVDDTMPIIGKVVLLDDLGITFRQTRNNEITWLSWWGMRTSTWQVVA